MNHEDAREILTACGIQWQAVGMHTTQRGRVKTIVTGLPGPLFWHRYKNGMRARMTAAGLTIRRLSRGCWEVVCWPRRETRPILKELGFAIPETEPQHEIF